MSQVQAAQSLKSSIITFVLMLGFALLGPALLAAAVFFHRKKDSRSGTTNYVPETPRPVFQPYLHGP